MDGPSTSEIAVPLKWTVLTRDSSCKSLSRMTSNEENMNSSSILSDGSRSFTSPPSSATGANLGRFRDPTSWIKRETEETTSPLTPVDFSAGRLAVLNKGGLKFESVSDPNRYSRSSTSNATPFKSLGMNSPETIPAIEEGRVKLMAARLSKRSSSDVSTPPAETESKVKAMISTFSQKPGLPLAPTSALSPRSTSTHGNSSFLRTSPKNLLCETPTALSRTVPIPMEEIKPSPPPPRDKSKNLIGESSETPASRNHEFEEIVVSNPLQSVATLSKMFDTTPAKVPVPMSINAKLAAATAAKAANTGTVNVAPRKSPMMMIPVPYRTANATPGVSTTVSIGAVATPSSQVSRRPNLSFVGSSPDSLQPSASLAAEEEKESCANDTATIAINGIGSPRLITTKVEGNAIPSVVDDSLDKPYRDFYKSVLEIVTKEYTFISNWHLANRLLIKPLLERLGLERTNRLIPLTCWNNIFRFHEALLGELMATLSDLCGEGFAAFENGKRFGESAMLTLELDDLIPKSLAELGEYNEKLKSLVLLEPLLTKIAVCKWFASLNGVMMRHADALMIARNFIVNYPTALEYLESMSSKKKTFLASLEQHPELDGLRFRDFLIQPVQNMCRYHLLYKTVTDKAPTLEIAAVANIAQTKFAHIAQRVNESIKNEERKNAEELMNRIKVSMVNGSSGSSSNTVTGIMSAAGNRISGRLLTKSLFPLQRYGSSTTMSLEDDLGLNEVTSVPLREGQIQIQSFTLFPLLSPQQVEDLKVHQHIADMLIAKGKVHGLLLKNQLLILESGDKRKSKPVIMHSFRFHQGWSSIRVEEDMDNPEVIHLIMSQSVTVEDETKDEDSVMTIEFDYGIALESEASKPGWIKDLNEVARVVDNARQREQMARRKVPPTSLGSSPDSVGSDSKNVSFRADSPV